jgi:peptidyl-prolyl cis-trans isomerase C
MKSNYLIIIVFSLLLAACNGQETGSGSNGEGPVVLVEVDGSPITLPMLEQAMEARGVREDEHERMRELLDELIRMQAVANAARAEGVADEPGVQAELRLTEMQTLFGHYLDRALSAEGVSPDQVREAYDAQLARSGDTQYRIEIIGYEDQARALKAIKRLQDGETDYAELHAEAQASELRVDEPGWIDRSQVPEDFAARLVETGTGEVVAQPLQSNQGWYLVRVVDTRPLEVPAFEEVREGIARSLVQRRRQALIESLYDQAEITPMLPLDDAEAEAGSTP